MTAGGRRWCDDGGMRAIGEIATFVTSKNAGPFLLTLDIVFPDEGHGFRKKENRITAAEAYRKFLDRYLKSR